MPFLLIYPPTGGRRKRVRLPPGTYDIGRRNCDVNLNYEGIADLHASLMAMPDGNIYVQDRGSGLPTLLNGHQVSLSPFQPGDNVQIGTVTFGLEPPAALAQAQGETAPPAPAAGPSDAGAGAWVQAALRGDRSAGATTPPPEEDASGPLPVRRIGKEDAERAQRVAKHVDASVTDPHVTAKDWVRQALEDSERRKRGEILPGEQAPSFAGNAGPRTVKRKKARRVQPVTPMTGPERAAAARFSKLQATMSFLPAYKKRKRRRAAVVVGILLLLAGVAVGGTLYIKKMQKEARANEGYFYVGAMDKPERGERSNKDLGDTSGEYSGVQAAKGESKSKRRGRSGGRGGRSADKTKSTGTASTARADTGSDAPQYAYDDGIVLSEAGTDEVIRAGERAGPVYGPGGSRRGTIAEGERLRGGYVHVDDPNVIAIGNPGANAPVIAFGSPNLDGMMYDESDGGEVQRMQELEFELADDTGPSGRGFVDMRAVENVLHGLNPSTRMCYSRALENSPGLKGTMVLILTLGTSGQMTSVSLDMTSSSLTDTDLKRCIERQIKSRNYPIPDGGSVTFSYPFRFSG